jgi:glycine/D-amino acid oxidase-like deaminating enzyme
MEVSHKPDYDRQNGWYEILPALPPANVLDGDVRADYVVVGAGFGGLAVARRLAELDSSATVALVEADRLGNNAAGRSSGFVIDHAHNIRAKGFADDTDNARKQIELNRAGVRWLEELVAKNDIDCDWRMEGKIHAAATRKGVAMLDSFARSLDAVDEDYTMLHGNELKERFGTGYYRMGLHAPHTALVQPAALVQGLGRSLPANVTLYEETPIDEVEYGTPHRLVSARGSVTAPTIILAANGFGAGFGFFAKNLIPLITWASMTRPLNDDEAERLGGHENYAIIPAHPGGTTIRRRPDRRILVRNVYSYSRRSRVTGQQRERARSVQRKAFENRYPMLGGIGFDYSWGGALSLSRNGAGVCGPVADNVYATMVYQGTGIAKGTISGKFLAEHIMGHDDPLLGLLRAGGGPSRNYPDPFNRWGVRLNARWRRYQAGAEE